jgi:hypothetical protein
MTTDRYPTRWTRHADAYNYACRLHKSWQSYGTTFSIKRENSYGRRWVIEATHPRGDTELRALVRKTKRLSLPF